jgi:hypothetical protein
MALALHVRLGRGVGSEQRKVDEVDVELEDNDVVLLQPECLDHGLLVPHEEQRALEPSHADAILAELTVAERHADRCLRCHLQHPGHLPGNGRWHGQDDKVTRPEVHVEVPWHLDHVLMSQARSTARHLLGLPLPETNNCRWNVWPRIDVGVQEELVLLVQRVMHIPGDDSVPVLYMVRK